MKHLCRFLSISLLLFCLVQTSFAQAYRILISNDDGIKSTLLETLSTGLSKLSDVEVVIVAPAKNQSGSSHSTDGRTLEVEKIFKNEQLFGYAVSGRPADAVRFGLTVLGKDKPFDLVVSGINRGANVGKLSHLSGTVGAAMEALYYNTPAIAVSQEVRGVNTEASALFISQLVSKYQKNGAPEGVVISVNIPAGELKGVVAKPMGDAYLDMGDYGLKSETGNKAVYQQKLALSKSKNTETDTYAYQQGYITITPLKFDWTAHKMLEDINSWGLTLKKN
ncbi:MAG: 5'/3'-nucleotidase SurE [Roseivirga sp.]|nr:5'/3'-nucleotidase SurE [Roseivirga sp.]